MGWLFFNHGVCCGDFQKDPVKTVMCFEAVILKKCDFNGPLLGGDASFEEVYYKNGEERILFDKEADFNDKTSPNYVVSKILTKDSIENRFMLKMFPRMFLNNPIATVIILIALFIERRKKPNQREVKRQCYFPNHPTKQNKLDENCWGNGGFFDLGKHKDGKWYIVKIR